MLGPAYQLIFNRRVTKRTPSRYRTRVITDGVTPSLHVDYKRSRIKQYFKEGRALRAETVINDTYDFGIGRSLKVSGQIRTFLQAVDFGVSPSASLHARV